MNKKDLVELVAKVTCTKKEAQDAVTAVIDSIKASLRREERITLSGLGTFSIKVRMARVGRNPKTGEMVQIPTKKIVKFKAAEEILEK
ncbi:MAG: HU family DNA-binding protein [Candidatus Omnitrophica bacterium]|nr:HU family DNA-binding protein [Candidatus Omnitrophota bacterium]